MPDGSRPSSAAASCRLRAAGRFPDLDLEAACGGGVEDPRVRPFDRLEGPQGPP